jgi:hypothetical protein
VASSETGPSLPEPATKAERKGAWLLPLPLYWLSSSIVVLLADLWLGPFVQLSKASSRSAASARRCVRMMDRGCASIST